MVWKQDTSSPLHSFWGIQVLLYFDNLNAPTCKYSTWKNIESKESQKVKYLIINKRRFNSGSQYTQFRILLISRKFVIFFFSMTYNGNF